MVRYNAVEDPLCYPGTHVLRNIPDIQDQDELDEFEQLMFDSRAQEDLPEGNFDFKHYKSLHRHFFQDVYEWAGECRKIRTGKGQNWFCYPEYIEKQANRLFQQLADREFLANEADEDAFAESAAWFLAEINAIHAFREGNGRIQLVFLTMLARNAGFELNEDNLRPEEFLNAMIRSFDGELAPLTAEIRRLL
ncbi:Fic family protein [Labrenzia sp. ac12]|uniref:Fic/DOC family protein n=1 Tax=Labrenzia sp. THAF35 TaxID=2587854 RepID=UPI001267F396|nr:Fic family protein [Labrenzia sp. THAF35]QFT68628.1 Adenosine monophosphate-protein transferase VbhT [Labrenzia sp. THAF35]